MIRDEKGPLVREISTCDFSDLLPIPVTLTAGCLDGGKAATDPKPSKNCITALLDYCKSYSGEVPM
jgi:hypothetical protein